MADFSSLETFSLIYDKFFRFFINSYLFFYCGFSQKLFLRERGGKRKIETINKSQKMITV